MEKSIDKDQMHQEFKRLVKSGHEAQVEIMNDLKGLGFNATVPALEIRPNITDPNTFTDTGDLFIEIRGKKYRFEVKEISMAFTRKEDFPRSKIIVDMVSNWEKKESEPVAYINISKKTKGRLVIFTSFGSQDEWWQEDVIDRRRNFEQPYYFIKINSPYVKSWEYFLAWLKRIKGE